VIATKARGGVRRALSTASLKALAVLPEAEREITIVDDRSACEEARQGISGSACEGCKADSPRTWAFREWEHSKRGLKIHSAASLGEDKSRSGGARV
jgi:hypothetical protein